MKRKNIILYMILSLMLLVSAVAMTACGSSDEGTVDETTQVQATEETVHAADPMTEEEMQNDDSEGCIEDSEDLLY